MDIRQARPSDSGMIEAIIYSSGPELYDFLFTQSGKTALDFIRYEFESGRGLGGCENVSVVSIDNRVVATGCFFSGEQYMKLLIGTIRNVFNFYGLAGGMTVLLRMRHVDSIMKTPKKRELYLSNFGVSSEVRSQGIGKRFIEGKVGQAKIFEHHVLILDVAQTNPRAEALYTRLGFKWVKNKTFSGRNHPAGANVPDSREMALSF